MGRQEPPEPGAGAGAEEAAMLLERWLVAHHSRVPAGAAGEVEGFRDRPGAVDRPAGPPSRSIPISAGSSSSIALSKPWMELRELRAETGGMGARAVVAGILAPLPGSVLRADPVDRVGAAESPAQAREDPAVIHSVCCSNVQRPTAQTT